MSSFHSNVPGARKVGALTADGRGTVIEQPMPELTRGTVLVRTTRSIISAGTHLGGVRRLRQEPRSGDPTPFGYQCAGEIVALGEGVTQFVVGERVAGFGNTANHSDWNVIPQNLCVRLSESVTDEQASGMNLVLTAINANRRAETMFGEFFLVVGMGIVGQLSAQIAQQAGCRVMAWDTLAHRLDIARNWGIDATNRMPDDKIQKICTEFTTGLGFDAAIMAFGGDGTNTLEQVKQVMKITRDHHHMGRVVFVGQITTNLRWSASFGNLDFRNAARTGPGYHDKPWELGDYEYPPVFARWNTRANMELAVRWIAERRIQIEPLITHRLPLGEFEQAVDLLVEKADEALGVVVDSSGEL